MFKERNITKNLEWLDETGVKIYTISIHTNEVDHAKYLPRLKQIKASKQLNWPQTAAFAIFHDGARCDYLVLLWWGNGNELFTSVSVYVNDQWLEDPDQYSFCLYDLEVMWAERNIYIHTMDCSTPSLTNYRQSR